MTARLRVLPISTREEGQPQHYLILDRLGDLPAPLQAEDVDKLEELARRSGGVAIMFGFPVDLPDVDESYADHAREEHAREQAYKAAHWEKDPDTPGAVREIRAREATTPAGASYQELAEEAAAASPRCSECASDAGHNAESSRPDAKANGEPPVDVCKALREVEHSGWVACDGTGHDREHHSGRLTAGPFVGQRWVWPFGPTDHAKREELAQAGPVFTVTVHAEDTSQDVARKVRRALREHQAITVRRA